MNQARPDMLADPRLNYPSCDLEPIHTPSLIQPHGLLLAARCSDQRIVFVSENSTALLGLTPARVFQQTLPELLGNEAVRIIEAELRVEQPFSSKCLAAAIRLRLNGPFEAGVHRRGDLLCVELEPVLPVRPEDPTLIQLERAIKTLGQYERLEELCAAIPRLVRGLTGYDRVMLYRFLPDGGGQVIAEDRDPSLPPFLGLHYPASDIPRQARQLYLQKWLTMIPDVAYVPVRVLRNPELPQYEPLDMTECTLRSVSPMHIEYQKNMGVAASLGLSLVNNHMLWGLIICHHRKATLPAPETRTMCLMLGQILSIAIGAKQQAKDEADRVEKVALLETLSQAMQHPVPRSDSLVAQQHALLALTHADGAVIRIDGRTQLAGKTPPLEHAAALMSALHRDRIATAIATDDLGALQPAFASLAPLTCGAVFAPLHQPGDGILWLRSETVHSIRWAGHPDAAKEISSQTLKINPRKSFAVWEQVERGKSLPWTPGEVEAANTLRDLIQREQMEEALREQAELLDLAPGMVRDSDGRIALWNEGSRRLYGYLGSDAIGQMSHELLQTQFPQPLEQIEAQLARTGFWEGELIQRKRDGTQVAVASLWTSHCAAPGRPPRVLVSNIDITERKRAEQQLVVQAEELKRARHAQESQTRMLESVLQSMTEGLMVVDQQAKPVLWNSAAEKILAMAMTDLPPEALSQHYGLYRADMVTRFPTDELPIMRATRGEASTTEMFVRNPMLPQGIWIEVIAGPRKDIHGSLCGGVAAFRDITKAKAADLEIRQLNEDLKNRNRDLERSNLDLQQFAYVASHDLQTPLRSITGFVQLLEMEYAGKLDQQADDWIRRTIFAIEQMQGMIEGLLSYSRVDARPRPFCKTSMLAVFRDTVALLEPSILDSQGQVTCGDLPDVIGDRPQLVQLLQNLIGNGLKYHGDKPPRVHVSGERNGAETIFSVRDNGVGIDPEYYDQIFEIFKRLHDQQVYPGTGIGLAVCRRVVGNHGGRIWVESEPGHGTVFYFTLPEGTSNDHGHLAS